MEKARKLAHEAPNQYLVILVLTDGGLQDYPETCDILVQCGRLPLSIIMVGIGKGDFALMHNIDDNNMLMTDGKGQRTERDLVTFVDFSKCNYNAGLLAHEVMKELPGQIVSYCKLVGLRPENMVMPYRPAELSLPPSRIGGGMVMSTRSFIA